MPRHPPRPVWEAGAQPRWELGREAKRVERRHRAWPRAPLQVSAGGGRVLPGGGRPPPRVAPPQTLPRAPALGGLQAGTDTRLLSAGHGAASWARRAASGPGGQEAVRSGPCLPAPGRALLGGLSGPVQPSSAPLRARAPSALCHGDLAPPQPPCFNATDLPSGPHSGTVGSGPQGLGG